MASLIDTQHPRRPHAVCVPHPAQGHINPMFQLAKLLHHKGFHITFVNTEFNQRRLLKSQGPDSLNAVPTFRFETIPDGLPPSDADATQDIPSLCDSTRRTCSAPFQELLTRLNNSALSNVNPPVTCIVSDWAMGFTLKASKQLNIPNVLFFTASACGFTGYVHYRHLVEKCIFPLKDLSYLTNGYMDSVIDWIPGMEGIQLKYLPSFIRSTDRDDFMVNFVITEIENAHNASALIFNTFDDLEPEVLEELSSIYPNIFTIGPLNQLVLNNEVSAHDSALSLIGSNLWKEQPGCLEWLDSKEQNSVVYVNFGSVDARFRFSSFYDQDPCSINSTMTRRSPSNASSPDVPAHTDKSEYAGCSPGANPPTLKSDMKASSESQSSALFETVWDSNCCVMGKTWDLACYATVQGKAWLPRLCETLRVTPRFWGKCGCHGSVRSCVLRRGSGESVAVVPRFSCWRARLANCRRPGLLASRSLAGMASCLL